MTEIETPKRRRGAPWWVWTLPGLLLVLLPTLNHFFAFQVFRQPSGSMQPTLSVGDTFAVTKWAYGYNQLSFNPFSAIAPDGHWFARAPQRGDIIVFEPNPEPGRFFIKRVIGLPGDRIQVIEGVVRINGEIVPREAAGEATIESYDGVGRIPVFRETLPNGVSYTVLDRGPSELDNTRVYAVPDGHVFVMGDDRDNSADSRVLSVVGFVPMDHIIGRVDHIFAQR